VVGGRGHDLVGVIMVGNFLYGRMGYAAALAAVFAVSAAIVMRVVNRLWR